MFIPLEAIWVGDDKPTPYQMRNASGEGGYLATSHRWYPGSIVMLSLRYDRYYLEATQIKGDAKAVVQVRGKVVHHGKDGVGVRFIHLNDGERRRFQEFLAGAEVRATA